MDIGELRRQIDSGKLKLSGSYSCIESGKLINNVGEAFEYEINHGWDILSANSCDRQWGSFNIRLSEYIKKQNYSDEELNAVLSSIQLEHIHWDWFKKSVCYTADGYEWFYIFADSKPQGACLIYHPKDSIIDSGDIFYIEFLAVAPWNIDNPIAEREFKRIGSLIIKCVLNFAVNTLKLKPGFSLHSLPQSKGFYEKLGMENYPERDKDGLAYFEISRAKSAELLGAA
ncbi:MAG: N-acetyltransferase [Asgard group archaeon]|nr:N-acetyltransferase [Asgard group archaeon]NVM38367.1 N-acetyltransferase [Candidatus Lokiarchaeota archaeon]